MPSKKKKYNARFPAGRIKKIMQSDEEVGKVAQAVPVIISRTLELFVGSLLQKAMQITSAKHAKTLTPAHMKQCILSEQRFDFLKDLVKSVQDSTNGDDDMSGAGPGLLVPGPNRSFPQRRKSSCSSIKEETVIKEEITIKEEASDGYSEMSNIHKNPNFHSDSMPDQIKLSNVIKSQTITEPQANCSSHNFSPNFYSESGADQRQFSSMIKTEPDEGKANCSSLPFNPNYYPEPSSAHLIKTEPVSNSSTIRYGPNFYSESGPEQRNTDPQTTANCSTLRFSPNFYSETLPEQKVSIHRPPVHLSPPVAYQEPTRIAHLTMDEDYDT